jgi:hypothetical protein
MLHESNAPTLLAEHHNFRNKSLLTFYCFPVVSIYSVNEVLCYKHGLLTISSEQLQVLPYELQGVPRKTDPHSLLKYKSTYSRKTLHMVQTKIWQMTLFENLNLFANHYGNLQEMLELASFIKHVDLYLTSEWKRF